MHHYNVKAMFAGNKDIGRATQPKGKFTNKMDRGLVVIIGGSKEYHGAPALASLAAQNVLASLRVGAGYAIAYVPAVVAPAVRSQSSSIIVNDLGKEHIIFNKRIKDSVERADAVALGMGIGRKPGTLKAAAKILDVCFAMKKKVVVDADAIRALHYTKKKMNKNVVVTPQDREFEFLSGENVRAKKLGQRITVAAGLAKKLGVNVLLKGHDTVITDGKRVKINRSKSTALATMGTGDVLSGIIGGYAATGTEMFDAAVAGAYLHSRIGDELARKMGSHIISSDVVEYIPSILKKFDKLR